MNIIKKKKKIIGINIDEVLRAKWAQFDKYYVSEFGEEGAPEDNAYCFDFFKNYKWEDTVEEIKYLDENLSEDIDPKEYIVDPETGVAPVDEIAFIKEENKLSAIEVYKRFMYEDYLFEIFGSAPFVANNIDNQLNILINKYSNDFEFVILSKENYYTIPPTLFFLSKLMCRVKKIIFYESSKEVFSNVDIVITTDPELISNKKMKKKIIKVARPWNTDLVADFTINQIGDLLSAENNVLENLK